MSHTAATLPLKPRHLPVHGCAAPDVASGRLWNRPANAAPRPNWPSLPHFTPASFPNSPPLRAPSATAEPRAGNDCLHTFVAAARVSSAT